MRLDAELMDRIPGVADGEVEGIVQGEVASFKPITEPGEQPKLAADAGAEPLILLLGETGRLHRRRG